MAFLLISLDASGFRNMCFFLRGRFVNPAPNPQPGGPGDHSLFGFSPSTCLAWVTLPRVQDSTCIALRVIETRKLLHHDKVVTPLGAKAYKRKKARVRNDACKLRSEEIRKRYNIEEKNRFVV